MISYIRNVTWHGIRKNIFKLRSAIGQDRRDMCLCRLDTDNIRTFGTAYCGKQVIETVAWLTKKGQGAQRRTHDMQRVRKADLLDRTRIRGQLLSLEGSGFIKHGYAQIHRPFLPPLPFPYTSGLSSKIIAFSSLALYVKTSLVAMSTSSSTSKQLQIEVLLNGPASPPPAGTISDFHKLASLNTVFYLSLALCITFSSLAVLIRIYTRYLFVRSMGYDDCKS